MADNPYVNKVVYNNSTLIDLTEDTVTPEALIAGYTAHNRSGAPIVGSAVIPYTLARITGSITSTGSVVDTTVDLPSGYTYTNSVIVGFGYATSASEYRHGNNAFGSNERVFARLTSQNKVQATSNANGTVYFEAIIAKIA